MHPKKQLFAHSSEKTISRSPSSVSLDSFDCNDSQLSRTSSVNSVSFSSVNSASRDVISGYESPTPTPPKPLKCPPRPGKRRSQRRRQRRRRKRKRVAMSPIFDDALLGSSESDGEESQRYDMDPPGDGGASDPIVIDQDEEFENDKDRVRNRVLRQLDAAYLAPRRSPLFRRMYKKNKNADGSRSLKKNADIVMTRFKQLMKAILRPMLTGLGENKPLVAERLFYAALFIVKKRRVNHVQAWRKFGRSKRLIYGGSGLFNNHAYVTEADGDIHDDEEDTTTTTQSTTTQSAVKVDPGVCVCVCVERECVCSPPSSRPHALTPPLTLANHSHIHLFPGVAAVAPANMMADFPPIKPEALGT